MGLSVSRLLKYVLWGALALLLLVFIVYVTLWRTSDAEYDTQRANLRSLQDSTSKIADELSAIRSGVSINTLTADTVTTLKRDVNAAKTNLDSLLKSKAVARDSVAQKEYAEEGKKLSAYVSYLSGAVQTAESYQAVFLECRVKLAMQEFSTIIDKDEFDSKSSVCLSAISAAEASPSGDLKEVLVNDYIKNTRSLVDRLEEFFDGTEEGGSRVAIIEALSALDATVASSDLALPDASTSFSDFDKLLESRKAAIIR